MDYSPLTEWLKIQVIHFVMDGPRLPGRTAEILFNWAMSEHNPTRISGRGGDQ